MTTKMTTEDFLSYIEETKSKNTYKSYKYGIGKFSEWFKKPPNEILEMRKQDWISGDLHQKKRFMREIEKFHKWLIKQGYTINSARNMCLGIMQLFRYYEMPVTVPTGSDVSKTVPSTKDFVPKPQQYRQMYKVADDLRSKLILTMGKDLAWRIGDFVKIHKEQLPDLEQDAPIPFELITEKEDVIARSFLSSETVELLKQYLPTLPQDNLYLFPSNKEKYIDPDTINRILRRLAKRANVRIPKNKRLRFHAFRKRFLSECANLRIDVNIAKILVGKDVAQDMLAYLSEVEHRKAFRIVNDILRLTDVPMRKTRKPTTELERDVEQLKRLIHGIIALGGKGLLEEARKASGLEDVEIKNLLMKAKTATEVTEAISRVGEAELKKQQEEYKRIIAENNNNNH